MESEPEKPLEEAPAPSRKVRMAWWGGIYCGIIIVSMIGTGISNNAPFSEVGMIVLGMVVWVLGTPLGFLPTLFYPIEWIADRYWGAGPLIENWSEVLCPLSYIVFLVHFKWTFYAENRRAFLLLMFSLVLLVSASLVGCSKEMRTIDLQH